MTTSIIKLTTEAGDLVFSPVKKIKSDSVFDFLVHCEMNEKYRKFLTGDFECRFYLADLKKLVSLFEDHVLSLVKGGSRKPFTYMPLEGDIQITCLDGEAEDLSDGYFSLLFMFNCGKADDSSSNAYFGFESVVCFSSVKEFCQSVERFINDAARGF